MTNTIIPAKPARPIVVEPGQPPAQVRVDASGRIPPGGATGQSLVKLSDDDFATGWGSPTVTVDWADVSGKPTFAAVATSGAYGDLSGLPTLFDGAWASLTGVPAVLSGTTASFTTAQETKLAGIATGATANATDADLRNRTTHTGNAPFLDNVEIQIGAGSDLRIFHDGTNTQMINSTGLLQIRGNVDLLNIAGTETLARFIANDGCYFHFDDVVRLWTTGAGAEIFGNLVVSGTVDGRDVSVDGTKLDGIAAGATVNATDAALRDRATHTGTQTAATISDFNASARAQVEAELIAGTNITITPSGTGATRQLTIAAAGGGGGGGGSPGGASGEVQFNSGGTFAGAADVEIEGGQLRLPSIATPTTPAAGGAKLYATSVGGRILPTFMGPSGLDSPVQPHMGVNKAIWWIPHGNSGTAITSMGLTASAAGTATTINVATTSKVTMTRRIGYHVTTAATNAIAWWRQSVSQFTVGGTGADTGGFHLIIRFAPSLGLPNSSHRAFCGMRPSAAPSDVNPSTLLNIVGVGYDAADANWQAMANDGSGTATKVDLGGSFPKPTTNDADLYELALFSPPGTTRRVDYRFRNLVTGAVATGSFTTDLPATTTLVAPALQMSVGGVSSTVGISIASVYVETDY